MARQHPGKPTRADGQGTRGMTGNVAPPPVPTSYLTLYEEDGAVCVRVGAASTREVVDLVALCSVSLVVREPEVVELRLRLSALTVTQDALVPYPACASEHRGAWLRVLSIYDPIIRAIQSFPIPDTPHEERWWLCTALREWRALEREEAVSVLSQPSARAGDTVVLLRGAPEPLRRLILASAPVPHADRGDDQ